MAVQLNVANRVPLGKLSYSIGRRPITVNTVKQLGSYLLLGISVEIIYNALETLLLVPFRSP